MNKVNIRIAVGLGTRCPRGGLDGKATFLHRSDLRALLPTPGEAAVACEWQEINPHAARTALNIKSAHPPQALSAPPPTFKSTVIPARKPTCTGTRLA